MKHDNKGSVSLCKENTGVLSSYLLSTVIWRTHWGLKVSVYIKRLLTLLTVFQYSS